MVDLRVQQPRDRAALLRVAGGLLETGFRGAGDAGGDVEVDVRDSEAGVLFLERHGGGGRHAGGRGSGGRQLSGERHREAASMRGRDQFFGIRPDATVYFNDQFW
jgi:hypothetical protein